MKIKLLNPDELDLDYKAGDVVEVYRDKYNPDRYLISETQGDYIHKLEIDAGFAEFVNEAAYLRLPGPATITMTITGGEFIVPENCTDIAVTIV